MSLIAYRRASANHKFRTMLTGHWRCGTSSTPGHAVYHDPGSSSFSRFGLGCYHWHIPSI